MHTGGTRNRNKTNGLVPGDGLWAVNDNYTYTTVKSGKGGRSGHPNGIDAGDLKLLDSKITGNQKGYVISYDFTAYTSGIPIGENFSIAYSPWCANDIIGGEHVGSPPSTDNEVPAPGSVILFGSGLLGMLGIALRRREQDD